jgi:ribosomal protein L37AE/L43A
MAILDWFKEIPLSAVLKERLIDLEKKLVALEKENAALKEENATLKLKLEGSEQQRRALEEQAKQKLIEPHNSNPLGYYCDHCGSQKLKRIGSRSDPTFGVLGIKEGIFLCNDCGKESAFTQNP